MRKKKFGAIAIKSLALLAVFALAYGPGPGGCLTALWSFARMAGGNWLLR